MVEGLKSDTCMALIEERVSPPIITSGLSATLHVRLPPSLSQGVINSNKDPAPSPPSSKISIGEDFDSEFSVSSPDYSSVANSFEIPDEVLCEQSMETDLQKLFRESSEGEKSELIPPFFEKAGINLVPISGSQ